MDDPPRFSFFSLTFLLGFGAGVAVGLGAALFAFVVADDQPEEQPETIVSRARTATATASPEPTPVDPRPRTLSALEVRLGPGEAYAIVGLVSSGDFVDILGRNDDADWVAIQFPPGSSGRGWVPIDGLDRTPDPDVTAVVFPTPLARGIPLTATPVFGIDDGPSTPGIIATPVVITTTAPIRATATPAPLGSPDLAVTQLELLSDGRVRVTVGNRGSANLTGYAIFLIVRDNASRTETLRAGSQFLAAGSTISLVTSAFRVTAETEVVATVDPATSVPDGDRSNNSLFATLAPVATATP